MNHNEIWFNWQSYYIPIRLTLKYVPVTLFSFRSHPPCNIDALCFLRYGFVFGTFQTYSTDMCRESSILSKISIDRSMNVLHFYWIDFYTKDNQHQSESYQNENRWTRYKLSSAHSYVIDRYILLTKELIWIFCEAEVVWNFYWEFQSISLQSNMWCWWVIFAAIWIADCKLKNCILFLRSRTTFEMVLS